MKTPVSNIKLIIPATGPNNLTILSNFSSELVSISIYGKGQKFLSFISISTKPFNTL